MNGRVSQPQSQQSVPVSRGSPSQVLLSCLASRSSRPLRRSSSECRRSAPSPVHCCLPPTHGTDTPGAKVYSLKDPAAQGVGTRNHHHQRLEPAYA